MKQLHAIVRVPLIGLLALASSLIGVVSVYALGTWTTRAPLPAPTEGMCVDSIGNKIYAAYGYSGGDTNLLRIYDISTDTWSSGPAAPGPTRSEGAGIQQADFLYCIGGRSNAVGSVIADVDRFEPSSNTWASVKDMPTARAGLGLASVGNKIYAIGGRTGTTPCSGTPLSTVERYDPTTDSWTTVAPLLSPRSDLAATEVGGKIYVFGGCTGTPAAVLNTVDVYDPTTNTWSKTPADMPTARASMYAVGARGNTVYVFGGQVGGVQLNVNEAYKVSSDTWSADTPMLTPRAEMGAASHGGLIYAVGGGFFGVSTNATESFKP